MTSDPKTPPCPPTSLTAEELEDEQKKVRNWRCLDDPYKPPVSATGSLLVNTATTSQMFVPQVRELQEQIQKAAACTCLLPLGRDRIYRRYWLLPSARALFVEDDSFGLTEDMLQPSPNPAQDAVTKTDNEEVKMEPAEGR